VRSAQSVAARPCDCWKFPRSSMIRPDAASDKTQLRGAPPESRIRAVGRGEDGRRRTAPAGSRSRAARVSFSRGASWRRSSAVTHECWRCLLHRPRAEADSSTANQSSRTATGSSALANRREFSLSVSADSVAPGHTLCRVTSGHVGTVQLNSQPAWMPMSQSSSTLLARLRGTRPAPEARSGTFPSVVPPK
jgi:hypothetical protein